MNKILSFAAGAALLYFPYVWCALRREDPSDYGIRWEIDSRALKETLAVSAAVLLILTPVALLWPWDKLPHARTLNEAFIYSSSGAAAAVIEETFFRGWLQTILRRRLPALPAILITSAVFASCHLFPAPKLFMLTTFFPGVIMGALREKYDNTLPGMIFHFLGNIWAVWFFPTPF